MQDQSPDRHQERLASPQRLCIVSAERALRWTELVVALRQTLSPQDELTIIVDRRRPRPLPNTPSDADRRSDERRHHEHLDIALGVDGFAIVPESAARGRITPVATWPSTIESARPGATDVADLEVTARLRAAPRDAAPADDEGAWGPPTGSPRPDNRPALARSRRAPHPRPPRLGQEQPADEQRDHVGGDDDDLIDDDDETSRRRPSASMWVLIGLAAVFVALALLVMGQRVGLFLVRLEPPRPSFANRPLPDHRVSSEVRELAPSPTTEVARTADAMPAPRRDAPVPSSDLPERRRFQPTPGEDATPGRKARAAAHPPSPTVVGGPPATVVQTFPGLPRVELSRSQPPAASGSGVRYVVRISDATGRPVVGAEGSLVGHMDDGSGLSIPLDEGPEPGTYHATVAHGSPLRDIRVRVVTNDARFEVPMER